MTEVEELLGCPPGDHTTGPTQMRLQLADGEQAYIAAQFAGTPIRALVGGTYVVWHGDRGIVVVLFNEEGKAQRAAFCAARRAPPDWWRSIMKGLGVDQ